MAAGSEALSAGMLTAPFAAVGEHIVIDLAGARALFTTRRGGVSVGPYASLNLASGVPGLARRGGGGGGDNDAAGSRRVGDDPLAVQANRARLANAVGLPFDRLARGRQVHGSRVRRVRRARRWLSPQEAPADGQAVAGRGMGALVLVADCLPIVLAGEEAVAVVHAGWRGLDGGIVAEGIRAVQELGGGAEVVAAIGPGAGGCCYEVGPEVHARFAGYPEAHQGRRLDLKQVARTQLEAAGVPAVHDVGLCTMCADPTLFFSHRRDGGVTGRQAGLAWLI